MNWMKLYTFLLGNANIFFRLDELINKIYKLCLTNICWKNSAYISVFIYFWGFNIAVSGCLRGFLHLEDIFTHIQLSKDNIRDVI